MAADYHSPVSHLSSFAVNDTEYVPRFKDVQKNNLYKVISNEILHRLLDNNEFMRGKKIVITTSKIRS